MSLLKQMTRVLSEASQINDDDSYVVNINTLKIVSQQSAGHRGAEIAKRIAKEKGEQFTVVKGMRLKGMMSKLKESEDEPDETSNVINSASEDSEPVDELETDENPDADFIDDSDNEEEEEDIGELADELGYVKDKKEMFLFGKNRTVTLLSKTESVEETDIFTQYQVNPTTGAWIFKAGKDEDDLMELKSGEDPSSLLKHLKDETKISAHQVEEYFN